MTEQVAVLTKKLSPNDLGITGGHQAGILVPRVDAAISFFPRLDVDEFNPRVLVDFRDRDLGSTFRLNFIYYNGKTLGRSSRNEHRLTGLTKYFRLHDAAVDDYLELREMSDGTRTIAVLHHGTVPSAVDADPNVIVLSGNWKTIRRGNFL
jgi:hypothetical protein